MDTVGLLYLWTDRVVFWGLIVLRAWAFVDCLIRKADAFPAVDKLTKPAWLAILLIAGVFGSLLSAPIGPISLISVIAGTVYLADVRPAVREISRGHS